MKVCTDSCILGAWTDIGGAKRILDIGTGTGLLALMLAQRSEAEIDAVEVEQDAFEEAKGNFRNSPWNDLLFIFHKRIQDYYKDCPHRYDLIISNPPFFTAQLNSSDEKRNIALHSKYLSFEELIEAVINLLKDSGRLSVILPPTEFEKFRDIAERKKLFLNTVLTVRDKNTLPVFRVAGIFSFKHFSLKTEELIIKEEESQYTDNFKELMKEYYLNF